MQEIVIVSVKENNKWRKNGNSVCIRENETGRERKNEWDWGRKGKKQQNNAVKKIFKNWGGRSKICIVMKEVDCFRAYYIN